VVAAAAPERAVDESFLAADDDDRPDARRLRLCDDAAVWALASEPWGGKLRQAIFATRLP